MKQLTKYILERLVLSKNKKPSVDSFKTIQMFMQDDQFDNNGLSLDYFIGITSNDQTVCYVECFNERYGNRFMLVIFNDDIYLDLVNEYNLEEDPIILEYNSLEDGNITITNGQDGRVIVHHYVKNTTDKEVTILLSEAQKNAEITKKSMVDDHGFF